MTENLRQTTIAVSPTKNDLVRELENETVTARRQELIKAIWRLDRQAVERVSLLSAQPRVAAAVAPEPQARDHQSAREPNYRPKALIDSSNAIAAHNSADSVSSRLSSVKQTLAALNKLYATERYSLVNYLRYAKPWVSPADQCLGETIRRIGAQQLEYADRVGSLIIERRGHVESESFPFRFTAYNDLSLAYLAPRVMEDQERIVRQVRAIAHQLRADAAAGDLATEILGAEQAHLDNLREILGEQAIESGRKSTSAALGERRRQDATHSVSTAA